MKIGINARALSVAEPSGSVQIGHRVIEWLEEISEIDVVIFGHQTLQKEFDSPVISTGFLIDSQVYGLIWERIFLPWVAKREDIDLLYCPNANAPLFSGGFKNVITYHDVNALKGYADPKYKYFRRALVPFTLSTADRVITVSHFSKEEIVQQFNIPTEKMTVVYNGIDQYFLDDSPGEPLELPDKYVLFTGSLNPRKNIEGVIESFSKFKDKYDTEYELVLIGPKNKAIFDGLRVSRADDIYILGFVSKEELKFAYRNASVFLYPSWYEGFGLPPLEAMACGTPVIAADSSALPEVLGDAAIYVNPHDATEIAKVLNDVLSDSCQRQKLVENGRSQVEKYNWDQSVSEMVDLFKSMV